MGHNEERRQPRPRRKFSDEFKRDAVDLVLTTGRPIAEVAEVAEVAAELGVYDSTLGNWVRRHQERQQTGSDVSPDERARLKELEADNAKLRMERAGRPSAPLRLWLRGSDAMVSRGLTLNADFITHGSSSLTHGRHLPRQSKTG